MNEILSQYGFTFAGNCHCDGYQTEKYQKGEYQLRYRVKKNLVKLKYQGHSKTQWNPVSSLEEILKTHTSDVAIQAQG